MNTPNQNYSGLIPFLAFIFLVACFVWITSLSLPDVVASHFGVSGKANGFMPRESYTRFMITIVVIVPTFLVVFSALMFRIQGLGINLPNRDCWLAPERREESIAFLSRHSICFGYLLASFLSYVHWLVVRANQSVPAGLPSEWFIGGLVVFVLLSLAWAAALFSRFGRVPR